MKLNASNMKRGIRFGIIILPIIINTALGFSQTQKASHNKSSFQQPVSQVNQIIIYGQSLSTGQQTAPAISVKNYAGNLMLGNQVWSNFSNDLDAPSLIFNPLLAIPPVSSGKTNEMVMADITINSASQLNAEPPVIGFTNAVKYHTDRYLKNLADKKFAATSCGEGGRSIELLLKDCPNRDGRLYAHFLKALNKSKEAADRMKKTLNCSAILWMQGEYNYTQAANQGCQPNTPATKNRTEYKSYFSRLVDDMLTDVKAAYRQPDNPVFITYQCGAQYTRDFDVSVGMAQLELANADPRVVLAAPVYPVSDRGGHLCPNGSRWYGEMMAKVYYKTVIKGEHWVPLQPKEIYRGKGYIEIDFSVPEPPLRIDTLTLEKARNYGFAVRQGGVLKTIRSVSLIGSSKIRIVVDSLDNKSALEINYAGPATQGNGNLCDSDNFQSFELYTDLKAEGLTEAEKNRFKPKYEPKDKNGNIIYGQHYPLQNFCCAFYYQIPEGISRLTLLKKPD